MWRNRSCGVLSQLSLIVFAMTEYALNQLPAPQLAELALSSATFIAVVTGSSVKIELYYLKGHFIELSFYARKRPGEAAQWRLYSANHFPDIPASTKYLTIYLEQTELLISD